MSRINDELEQAVRDGEAAGAVAGQARAASADEARPVTAEASGSAAGGSAPHGKMRWGLLTALLALMGGILTLVFTGGSDAVAYSYRVDEVKAQAGQLGERLVRVQGSLVAGTLVRRDNPCEYRFLMRNLNEKTGEALEVRYPLCVVPDTFRDKEGVEVTAEGRLVADGHLQASKIFAKCPSKYDPSTHEMGEKGQRAQREGASNSELSNAQLSNAQLSNAQPSNSAVSELIPARVETSAGVR
jgi:cytochrome c-type biogenesis protein CcmE